MWWMYGRCCTDTCPNVTVGLMMDVLRHTHSLISLCLVSLPDLASLCLSCLHSLRPSQQSVDSMYMCVWRCLQLGVQKFKKYIQKICKIIMGQYLLQCWRTDNIVCSLMLLVYLYTVHANSHVSVSVSVSPHCRPTWCGAALWAQSPGLEPWAEPVRH